MNQVVSNLVLDEEPIVKIEGVTKSFGSVYAVDDINLQIYRGEFFSLLGGSGCGKTTLLRMLAGFEAPTQGRIYIDGKDITDVPPYRRPINMMFQSYALFPHMTVEDNIAFGLKQEGMPAEGIKERVDEMLELVQVTQFKQRKPHQLSGGQRQRVALARALAKHPRILLLDEPLGALDKKLREKTQFELVNIQQSLGITFIVVTHDQEEAMTMSNRVALMRDGRIEQIDTPRMIYEFPRSRYAASFFGSINLFSGTVTDQLDDAVNVYSEETGAALQVTHSHPLAIGTDVTIAVRPEKLRLIPEVIDGPNMLQGVIAEIAYLGDMSTYHIDLPTGKRIQFTQSNSQPLAEQPFDWGQMVTLTWQPHAATVLTE
ncbi:MAG: ABC transporter ATP-binding protein [Sedimenticolaceae bacterium]